MFRIMDAGEAVGLIADGSRLGILKDIVTTVVSGGVGGLPASGVAFGAGIDPYSPASRFPDGIIAVRLVTETIW